MNEKKVTSYGFCFFHCQKAVADWHLFKFVIHFSNSFSDDFYPCLSLSLSWECYLRPVYLNCQIAFIVSIKSRLQNEFQIHHLISVWKTVAVTYCCLIKAFSTSPMESWNVLFLKVFGNIPLLYHSIFLKCTLLIPICGSWKLLFLWGGGKRGRGGGKAKNSAEKHKEQIDTLLNYHWPNPSVCLKHKQQNLVKVFQYGF